MQIELSDSGCLRMLVSDEELAALGVSFDELDSETPATRRTVRALLQMAREQVGYLPDGALLIEALPLCGGCLLLISPDTDDTLDAPPSPAVFFVADEDALLQIADAWQEREHRFGEGSSLYRADKGYWLLIYGKNIPPAAYECADLLPEGALAAAAAAEHAEPLFVGDALPRLCRTNNQRE